LSAAREAGCPKIPARSRVWTGGAIVADVPRSPLKAKRRRSLRGKIATSKQAINRASNTAFCLRRSALTQSAVLAAEAI
jgi:hypothetical protein